MKSSIDKSDILYDFNTIEKRVRAIWSDRKLFSTDLSSDKPKYYVLEMLPYPSGALHMGHVRNYTIGDAICRYKRMKGYDVVHPLGWDSFGLPAEQAAIKRGISPSVWTDQNIEQMKTQIDELGISYDWDREIKTSSESYYKWNQWLFSKMFSSGLAYKKKSFVNWSESLQTVLANEQVEASFCGSDDVIQKELEQWFFKITDYSEELLSSLDSLDWPESVKIQQRNWIGKKEGAECTFKSCKGDFNFDVYTTRLDTIFGVTYLALSKSHEFIEYLKANSNSFKSEIEEYIKNSPLTKEEKKNSASRGLFTGEYAINSINQKEIPIYVADYVLDDYGSAAVMGVPAHDERDFKFATEHNINSINVIDSKQTPNIAKGTLINSEYLNGMSSDEAINHLIERGFAKKVTNYRLKDWLVSRQRYWGTPIPIIYKDGIPELSEIPVTLPEDVSFTGRGNPIESSKEFLSEYDRETDTMDTFVDSSWYYLRYLDNSNDRAIFDKNIVAKTPQVDIYIGGIEHAVMHLLYARFIHKVLADMGLVTSREPFKKLLTQGMVLSNSYYSSSEKRYLFPEEAIKYSKDDLVITMEKMSKSKNNGVMPGDMISKYSADAVRAFILFAAPPTKDLEWNEKGITGVKRFLNKLFDICRGRDLSSSEFTISSKDDSKLLYLLNNKIEKITKVMERDLNLNVAISSLMELLNSCLELNVSESVLNYTLRDIVKMLSPFAPHICDEIWLNSNDKCLIEESWPEVDSNYLEEDVKIIPVQVNGRVRTEIKINLSMSKEEVIALAKSAISSKGVEIKKVIYIPGRIVNIVG